LTHIRHHRRKHYGTEHDGEYLPLSNRSPWHIVWYLAQSLFIPILAVIRFGVLTPMTWFNTPLRDWVLRHASSMIIDPSYLRPLPTAKALRTIRWQEAWVFAYIVLFGVLIYRGAFHDGIVSPWVLLQAYLTGVFIVTINAVRTLGAHRWLNKSEDEMTFVEQLVDSVNYDRGWLAELWAPAGLRYHALHHLFPSMPYHALGAAHRRLMADLPADSPYRATVSPSLIGELTSLWRRAAASQAKPEKLPVRQGKKPLAAGH
ncbi:MAG: fatty acid desaturase, partial [Planctomycetota bacterium]